MWERGLHDRNLPPNWKGIRSAVMLRDDRTCRFCGREATDVDHIRNRDDHRLDNLRALCDACHKRRTGRQGAAAYNAGRKRAKQTLRRPVEAHPGLLP